MMILLMLATAKPGLAQEFEWVRRMERYLNTPADYRLAADTDGNVFIFGSFNKVSIGDSTFTIDSPSGYDDLFLAKYNSSGQVIWARRFGGYGQYMYTGKDRPGGIVVDSEGNCYLTGDYNGVFKVNNVALTQEHESLGGFVMKFDGNGQLAWMQLLEGDHTMSNKGLCVDRAGNVLVAGSLSWNHPLRVNEISILSRPGAEAYLAKFSKDGNLAWLRLTGGWGNAIATDKSGAIFLTGSYEKTARFDTITLPPNELVYDLTNAFIAKLNLNGQVIWAKPVQGAGGVSSQHISVDASGKIYLMGAFNNNVTFGRDTLTNTIDSDNNLFGSSNAFLAQFEPAGKSNWGLRVVSPNHASAGDLLIGPTGNIYFSGAMIYRGMIGNTPFGVNYEGGIFYGKISQSGQVQWVSQILPAYFDNFNAGSHMATDGQGNLFLAGLGGHKFGAITNYGTNQSMFFTKIRDTTFTRPAIVRGKLFEDANRNCKPDPNEAPIPYQLVKAEPGPYYASTDSSGNYRLELPEGTYQISQIAGAQGLELQQTCPAPPGNYTVTFDSYGKDTTGFDFGNQVTRLPLLKVDVAADRRRRCFRSTTTVRYCNEGYAAAPDVQVKVYYPAYVVPISASMAWNKQDSVLTFNLGTLKPGACGVISIADSVICGDESIRGLTQCVKAVITPRNNHQPPDARWDQSDVDLTAVCRENGLVKLTIRNSGKGSMAGNAAYRIFLDAVKVFEGQYQLVSGDSLTLQVPANGRTIRLEADLRPYHPEAERKPSITLEGCGGAAAVSISKGFVNQLPPDDAPEEVSVSCLEILDSYDPNDKQVSPAGAGPQRIIAEGQELEYLIRFQNTGTDVAYNVVIEDTLSPHLDIATLRIGAASHPFTWSVSGVGLPVITWTFKDIHLPDSTSNEPASHGYVRFRVKPVGSTALGTQISNSAAITFDYNSPIITNQVNNTIGQFPLRPAVDAGVDVCSGNVPTPADAGENRVLDGDASVALRGNTPGKGHGYWRLISGKGLISNPADVSSHVNELGVGKNVFEWSITLCDSVSRSYVTVERVVIPPVPVISYPPPYCPDQTPMPVIATGKAIRWYRDKTLSRPVGEGNTFQPPANHPDTLYVTQTIDGYESRPAEVRISYKAPVPAPRVDSIAYICNGTLVQPLTATGELIRWYADADQTKLLQESNIFNRTGLSPGMLYVSQTVDGCVSKPAGVHLLTAGTDLSQQVSAPNVITPNGDGYNDAFRQPVVAAGACVGTFQSVRIYNRWGKTVFTSTDAQFAWEARGNTPGFYYYEIRYANYSFSGGISVLY
jgi:gliding motility-associated-like protein/uncharacterized repeat protein (TIGR01451 family)